jgi:GNAT superfamily N-acetyltransferase
MNYEITLEKFRDTYAELEPLYRQHYSEMVERLKADGVENYSPYNPRLDEYVRASDGGWLLTFVLRLDGQAVGYSNVYITNDMHNHDLIAQEDTVYVLPEHRTGWGRKLIHAVHNELRKRGVKRLNITTATDLRVSKLLGRMGYKHAAHAMTITF